MLGFFSFVVGFSLVFVAWAWFAARRPLGALSICSAAGVGWLSFVISVVLFLQFFFTVVFVAVCALFGGGVRARRVAVVAAFVVAYGFTINESLGRLARRAELRRQFPIESVSERLAYERRAEVAGAANLAASLSPTVQRRLAAADEQADYSSWRRSRLARLHDASYDAFVAAPGFGSGRMGHLTLSPVQLPEPQPVRQPTVDEPAAPYTPTAVQHGAPFAAASENAAGPFTRSLAENLHQVGVDDFLNADRLGYVKHRDHVVGFQSHRFAAMPKLPKENGAEAEWRVVRLELLGLLKGPSPHVYVSEYLPRMDELQHAATRPLNAFESQALAKLRTDDDLVIDESPNVMRMLGSLRAGKTCVQCHSVHRGELLGAFSYELRRTKSIPEKKPAHVATVETL